jgi:hypothetical protein
MQQALDMFAVEDEGDLFEEDKTSSTPQALNGQVEKITWDDIIIDKSLESELKSVVELLRDPGAAVAYGIKVPKGILLNGPPGTGKTTLAKVVANEAGLSFFSLQADEVISKWVGESEKNLTRLFKAAARAAPPPPNTTPRRPAPPSTPARSSASTTPATSVLWPSTAPWVSQVSVLMAPTASASGVTRWQAP